MLEIRFHGRGGQGTVLAAKMLADAVVRSGRGECLALPEFGVERRGAPVKAYARISSGPILLRTRIYEPDAVAVLDPSTAAPEAFVEGLKPGGLLLVNAEEASRILEERWRGFQVLPVRARRIALAHGLGSASSPVVNTPMTGALCAALDLCDFPSLEGAIRESVPGDADANTAAAREAFQDAAGVVARRARAAA